MNQTYIIVPGRSDHRPLSRRFYKQVEWRWRVRGMRVRLFRAEWQGNESYQDKLRRLLILVHDEHTQGRGVVFMGISAGAALGLLASHSRPQEVGAFISVCGLLAISPDMYLNTSNLSSSWFQAGDAAAKIGPRLPREARKRTLTLSAKRDNIIAPERERIPGVQDIRMPVQGHAFGIFVGLMIYRRAITRFVTSIG